MQLISRQSSPLVSFISIDTTRLEIVVRDGPRAANRHGDGGPTTSGHEDHHLQRTTAMCDGNERTTTVDVYVYMRVCVVVVDGSLLHVCG